MRSGKLRLSRKHRERAASLAVRWAVERYAPVMLDTLTPPARRWFTLRAPHA